MNGLVFITSVIFVSLVMDSHGVALPRHTICKAYKNNLTAAGYNFDEITLVVHHFDKPVVSDSSSGLYMIGVDHQNNPIYFIDNQCNVFQKTEGRGCVRGKYLEDHVWKQRWCSTAPPFVYYDEKRLHSDGKYFTTKEGFEDLIELGYFGKLDDDAFTICTNTSVMLFTMEGRGITQSLHHLITVPNFAVKNLPNITEGIPTLPQTTPAPIIIPLNTPIKRNLKHNQCYTYEAGETPCDRYKEDCANAECTLNTNFYTQIISGTKNEMWINTAEVFQEYKGPAYTCVCEVGFEKKNGSKKCTDIDECLSGTNYCNKGYFDCVNLSPGYKCVPKNGSDSSEREDAIIKTSVGQTEKVINVLSAGQTKKIINVVKKSKQKLTISLYRLRALMKKHNIDDSEMKNIALPLKEARSGVKATMTLLRFFYRSRKRVIEKRVFDQYFNDIFKEWVSLKTNDTNKMDENSTTWKGDFPNISEDETFDGFIAQNSTWDDFLTLSNDTSSDNFTEENPNETSDGVFNEHQNEMSGGITDPHQISVYVLH